MHPVTAMMVTDVILAERTKAALKRQQLTKKRNSPLALLRTFLHLRPVRVGLAGQAN